MTRPTIQLENGHAKVSLYAVVEAIYRPNGARGTWEAVEKLDDGTWQWREVREQKMPRTCASDKLVILRVLRRGFGE